MLDLLGHSAREEIRKQHPDTTFSVVENNADGTKESVAGVIATWPNKLDENPGIIELAESEGIGIVHLGKLGKENRNIDYLVKGDTELKDPSLISDGIIPVINHEGQEVIPVTERDKEGNADNEVHTSIAGRAEGEVGGIDLKKEGLREWLEEGAYFGEKDGETYILLPEAGKILGNAGKIAGEFIGIDNANGVRGYLNGKHLNSDHDDYDRAKTTFEKNFPTMSYEDFPAILREAYKKGNILFYGTKERDFGEKNRLILDGTKYDGFNYYDVSANTIEYRDGYDMDLSDLKNTKWQEVKGVKVLGNAHVQSAYFESKYQGSRLIPLKQSDVSKLLDINGKQIEVVATIREFIKRQNQ